MQVPEFLAVLDGRSDKECRELVEDVPIEKMTPSLIAHQRIAPNVERALNNAIEARGLERRADREIGLQTDKAPDYRPEPEVTIIDAEHERYASRFYSAVEVLSATDMARNQRAGRPEIDDKIGFYRSDPLAEFILVLSQEWMEVDLHVRDPGGGWRQRPSLVDSTDVLDLPGLCEVFSIAAIYKGVKLPGG